MFNYGFEDGYLYGFGVPEKTIRPRPLVRHLIAHTINMFLFAKEPLTVQKLHDFVNSIPHGFDTDTTEEDSFFKTIFATAYKNDVQREKDYCQSKYGVDCIQEALEKFHDNQATNDCMMDFETNVPECFLFCVNTRGFFEKFYIPLAEDTLRTNADQTVIRMLDELIAMPVNFLLVTTNPNQLPPPTDRDERLPIELDPQKLFRHFLIELDNA